MISLTKMGQMSFLNKKGRGYTPHTPPPPLDAPLVSLAPGIKGLFLVVYKFLDLCSGYDAWAVTIPRPPQQFTSTTNICAPFCFHKETAKQKCP